jgi:hypothetical protein
MRWWLAGRMASAHSAADAHPLCAEQEMGTVQQALAAAGLRVTRSPTQPISPDIG